MSPEDRTQILLEAQPNSWIALSQDESRVVGRGGTYTEAVEEAERNGEVDPLLIRTPEEWAELVLCA
jgi:hypothetical protein